MNKILATDYYNPDCSSKLDDYPFNQFHRNSYFSLNGKWQVSIYNKDNLLIKECNMIIPNCIESPASKINYRMNKGDYLIFKKSFTLKDDFIKDQTFINFLGIDQKFIFTINGKQFKEIIPLGLPSSIDISKYLKKNNEITIKVKDDIDYTIPYGKQVFKPHGMWYTPISGIYYPVFIESVNKGYIRNIKFTPTLNSVEINIDSECNKFNIEIYDNDRIIIKKGISNNEIIHIDNPHLWTVDDPFLYKVKIYNDKDSLDSYFALRTIKINNGYVYLNNKKIFIKAVLDQGYFPEGIYTPSSYLNYEQDILNMKALGFNTIRKHIKVELDYFYYLCDKLGMLVIQDFVSSGKYNYLRDTVFPTIGFIHHNDKFLHYNKTERENFINHYTHLISYLYNHPSVIIYTIFNEGWGQFLSTFHYDNVKKLDSSRLINTACGWFVPKKSDFNSLHLYFSNINKLQKLKKVSFLSEFGGYVYKDFNHSFNNEKPYGYKFFDNLNDYNNELKELFENKIIPYKDKLCGIVYTQITDVENEYNGLYTYDRKICKVNKKMIKNILNKLN